jgi:predicted SnoaL-like aldol condensation-catalyzing enzyme
VNDLKALALSFLKDCASGKARQAFAAHAAPGFKHHNVWFPGDAASLAKGMDDNAETFPNKVFEPQRALRDGDLVAVHSRLVLQKGVEVAVVHLLRFEGEKIAELWDLPLPVPEDSPNENGAF